MDETNIDISSDMKATYYRLLDEFKDLKPDNFTSKLNSLSVSFVELEKHGFDVEAPQLRISKLLSLQDSRAKMVEDKKCFEKKIEEEKIRKCKIEEELAELQRQVTVGKEIKEAFEKEMVELKMRKEMKEQDFQKIM